MICENCGHEKHDGKCYYVYEAQYPQRDDICPCPGYEPAETVEPASDKPEPFDVDAARAFLDRHPSWSAANIHELMTAFLAEKTPGIRAEAVKDMLSTDRLEKVIERALLDYRCTENVDEDGGGAMLVDVLTPLDPENHIGPGKHEIGLLTDYLAAQVAKEMTEETR